MESYGFTGHPNGDKGDPGNPNYSSLPQYSFTPSAVLWDSNMYGPYPTAYDFGTLYLGDPHNSPYGLAPYDGYKWRLTCSNVDGDTVKKIMYGMPY